MWPFKKKQVVCWKFRITFDSGNFFHCLCTEEQAKENIHVLNKHLQKHKTGFWQFDFSGERILVDISKITVAAVYPVLIDEDKQNG